MKDLENIVESLLFVADEPLTIDRLKKVLDFTGTSEIQQVLNNLKDYYENRKGGFYLSEVAGGYQFRTRHEYMEWLKRLIQPHPLRLSKPALETLATIAYKQPVMRSDIEHIRGVDCGGILRMLMKRKLVRVLGRKEIPGRPLIYATTKQFLEIFELKDLKDLPTPQEIQELQDMVAEQSEDTEPDSVTENENINSTSPNSGSEKDTSTQDRSKS